MHSEPQLPVKIRARRNHKDGRGCERISRCSGGFCVQGEFKYQRWKAACWSSSKRFTVYTTTCWKTDGESLWLTRISHEKRCLSDSRVTASVKVAACTSAVQGENWKIMPGKESGFTWGSNLCFYGSFKESLHSFMCCCPGPCPL